MADVHQHHDPTFYRTPRDAAEAPPEKLAYVATFSRPADLLTRLAGALARRIQKATTKRYIDGIRSYVQGM